VNQEILMPRLSDSMEEGVVLQWLKSIGDPVSVGDEIVEIETDKANMVYEADVEGTLVSILADEGETRAVGTAIAEVDSGEGGGDSPSASTKSASGGAAAPTPAEPETKVSVEQVPEKTDAGSTAVATSGSNRDRISASPLARRMAASEGIALADVSGTGPRGRIFKADVRRALADRGADRPTELPGAPSPPRIDSSTPAKGELSTVSLTRLQQTVGRRMAESKATAPHFYLETDVDMDRCVEARSRIKDLAGEGSPVPSFNDMVVKACAIALREFPRANGAYRDGNWELYSRVNVGIAVAGADALVVPTIVDADRKGLAEISAESRRLAKRVREGTVTPPELSGGTFTVSNLGMYGITSFQAVLNPPQAAILAVGGIRQVPVVRAGEVVPGNLMSINLACDHRILYGAEAAEFLARIKTLLEEPIALAM
jgi:pyruvate dehydrogenase E2 component (dihydrolipoamide acetyltransferase)